MTQMNTVCSVRTSFTQATGRIIFLLKCWYPLPNFTASHTQNTVTFHTVQSVSQSHIYEMYVLIHTYTGLALLNITGTRPEGQFGGRASTENSYITISAEESRRRTERFGHLAACWEPCRIGWSSMGKGLAGQWTSSTPLTEKYITLAHTLTCGTTGILQLMPLILYPVFPQFRIPAVLWVICEFKWKIIFKN